MLTLTLLLLQLQDSQRAVERIKTIQSQRAAVEQQEHQLQWAAEDAYAIAQRGRKATPAELARLVVPK